MSERNIETMKRNIETQLDEYEAEIVAYEAWMAAWRRRQPRGFRCAPIVPKEAAE
jgi:hypothetical protein